MQWSNHCVPWQIDLVGVVFGLRPRFCLCLVWFLVLFAAFSDETQVWLGDLRVVVFWWFCVFCCLFGLICLLIWTNCVLCTNFFSLLMLM